MTAVNVISVLASIITMVNAYLLAQGRLKPTYMLTSAKNLAYVGLNLAVFASDPRQFGMLLLTGPAVWSVLMSIFGLRRLKSETAASGGTAEELNEPAVCGT